MKKQFDIDELIRIRRQASAEIRRNNEEELPSKDLKDGSRSRLTLHELEKMREIIYRSANLEEAQSEERKVDTNTTNTETEELKHTVYNEELTNDDLELLKFFSQNPHGIKTRSKSMVKPLELLVAYKDDIPLFLTGDRGVGKGLFVKAVHKLSNRAGKKLIQFNGASREKELMASELFGSKKGAYTGADRDRRGLIEAAGDGTLFIDEVGRIPLEAQGNLLRVLEEGEFTPIGATDPVKLKARIICATNLNLQVAVEDGNFMPDLFDRINRAHIHIPSLKERPADITLLAKHFYDNAIHKKSKDTYVRDKLIPIIQEVDFQPLGNQNFKGNIRELKNKIESFVLRNYHYLENFHPSMIFKLVTDDSTSIKSLSSNPAFQEKYPVKSKHWIALRSLLDNNFNQTQATKYSAMRGGPKDKTSVLKYADTLLVVIAYEAGFQIDQMIKFLKDRGVISDKVETTYTEIQNRLKYVLSHHKKGTKKVIWPWADDLLNQLAKHRPDLM